MLKLIFFQKPANQTHAGDYIAGLVVAAVGRALSGVGKIAKSSFAIKPKNPPLAVRRSEWREREMVIS